MSEKKTTSGMPQPVEAHVVPREDQAELAGCWLRAGRPEETQELDEVLLAHAIDVWQHLQLTLGSCIHIHHLDRADPARPRVKGQVHLERKPCYLVPPDNEQSSGRLLPECYLTGT